MRTCCIKKKLKNSKKKTCEKEIHIYLGFIYLRIHLLITKKQQYDCFMKTVIDRIASWCPNLHN